MKLTLLLNTALLAMFFVAWCFLDYRLVRSPQFPGNSADDDWLFVFIPLVTFATNLVVHRGQGLRKSLLVAILASVALCVLSLVALIVLGIPFHLSIGGAL
jgi:ABC-type antimicrobial peptide transport system permease subunit